MPSPSFERGKRLGGDDLEEIRRALEARTKELEKHARWSKTQEDRDEASGRREVLVDALMRWFPKKGARS